MAQCSVVDDSTCLLDRLDDLVMEPLRFRLVFRAPALQVDKVGDLLVVHPVEQGGERGGDGFGGAEGSNVADEVEQGLVSSAGCISLGFLCFVVFVVFVGFDVRKGSFIGHEGALLVELEAFVEGPQVGVVGGADDHPVVEPLQHFELAGPEGACQRPGHPVELYDNDEGRVDAQN